MHLIIGALLSYALGKKSFKQNESLPSFKNVLEVRHAIPGRLRLYAPCVQNNTAAQQILGELTRVNGIEHIETNLITGSILINYLVGVIDPGLISDSIIRLLNLEKELERLPQSTIKREIVELGDAANRAVFDASDGIVDLYTLIPLALGAIGIFKLIRKSTSSPAAITMIWWAYMNLLRDRQK